MTAVNTPQKVSDVKTLANEEKPDSSNDNATASLFEVNTVYILFLPYWTIYSKRFLHM